MHYERVDMDSGPPPRPPAEPAAGARVYTLAERVVPNTDNSTNDTFKFVPGEFVRLGEPVRLRPDDTRSPLLVGHVVTGGAFIALFVGAVVKLRNYWVLWRVLKLATLTTGVVSTNRAAPIRGESSIADVTAHCEQTLQVFPPNGKIVSPRTWDEPPVEANMLFEREGHPPGPTPRAFSPPKLRPRSATTI